MLTYVPTLSSLSLAQGTSPGCLLSQGAVITDSDLNVVFCNSEMLDFSPYYIRYAVGFLSEDGQSHFYGSDTREPLKLREGRFRPNFQVGDNWFTGSHVLVWSYKVTAESELYTRTVPFTVTSAGIVGKAPLASGSLDVCATVIIVP